MYEDKVWQILEQFSKYEYIVLCWASFWLSIQDAMSWVFIVPIYAHDFAGAVKLALMIKSALICMYDAYIDLEEWYNSGQQHLITLPCEDVSCASLSCEDISSAGNRLEKIRLWGWLYLSNS